MPTLTLRLVRTALKAQRPRSRAALIDGYIFTGVDFFPLTVSLRTRIGKR